MLQGGLHGYTGEWSPLTLDNEYSKVSKVYPLHPVTAGSRGLYGYTGEWSPCIVNTVRSAR